jgi:hypothetical protein
MRSPSHAAAAALSLATGRGHEPRPVPGHLPQRSDPMIQKICFDCFHKLFPDKPILKVTLGRQCVVCKAQTDRPEQMIPVEAEDIPPVRQIAKCRATRYCTEPNGTPTGSAILVPVPSAGGWSNRWPVGEIGQGGLAGGE